MLAFVVSSGATCAGWQPTAEARRACCKGGGCHREASRPASDTDAHDVSQAEADGCCAASESETSESAPSTPLAVSLTVGTLLTATSMLVDVPPVVVSERWREAVPLPPSLVPTHLRLSVLLV